MNVLITGGLGFIGAFLAEEFSLEGHSVFVVDDRSANVVERVDCEMQIDADLRDTRSADFPKLDLVVHCASPVGAVGILDQRGSIVHDIVTTTRHALDLAVDHDAYLINISSSEVYGFDGSYRETDACVIQAGYNARREYALGKLAAEYLIAGSIEALSIRPFNVVGPRQSRHKGFVFPTFAEQSVNGEPLTVFDTGEQRRAFLSVRDLVSFIVQLAPVLAPVEVAGVVNVGNPNNETTINDLAMRFIAASGSTHSGIRRVRGRELHGDDYAEADGFVKLPSIERALGLGWSPTHSLDDLVAETVADTRETMNARTAKESV